MIAARSSLSPLRSWWKEEQATCCLAKRAGALLLGVTLLAGIGHLLHALSVSGRDELELGQQLQLQLLQQARRAAVLTARDWAQWDATLRFSQGQNPDFVRDTNLGGSHVFTDGAVLAIVAADGQLLTLQSRSGGRARGDGQLQRCLRGLHQGRQRNGSSQRDGLCRGSSGDYVGSAVAVSDNSGQRQSGASVVMLHPLAPTGAAGSLREGRDHPLTQPLRLLAGEPASPETAVPITPTLWDGSGRRWLRQQPTLRDGLLHNGNHELVELALALLAALLLRGAWMLNRRSQRLQGVRQQQQSNRQLRRSERELLALLEPDERDGLQPARLQCDQQQTFLRLLPREPQWHQTPPSGLQRGVVARFEQVLAAARKLALCDPLTGLPNRRYFLERLEREHAQRRQQGQSLAVLFIDLDGFKQINDTYGHAIGDRVLQHTAQQLHAQLRAGDFLARFGGDEFTLLLQPEESAAAPGLALQEQARALGAQLMEAVRAAPLEQNGPALPRVELSVGLVVADPRHCSPSDLLRRSDLAMYRQKRQRRQAG